MKRPARPVKKRKSPEKPLPQMVREHVQAYFRSHEDSLPACGLYDRLLPLFEKPLIEATLEATGGNKVKAAQLLGLNRNTLHKKMIDLGIKVTKTVKK